MSDFLDAMARSSRARLADAKTRRPESAALREARATPAAPPLSLDRFDLIAELKRRSPAAGSLADASFDRRGQIKAYAEGGAAAVSVLTEPDEFLGSLDDLREAAAVLSPLGLPAMRKDFLVDPYQLIEARAHGAGGALLIVAMLDDRELNDMLACAADLGLFVLLEAFDEKDLDRIAARCAPAPQSLTALIGVNCRNLRSLAVDFGRFAALADRLPPGFPAVAESGIGMPADIETVAGLGYRLALVGSALMRSGESTVHAAETVARFIAAGRDC